MRRQIASAIKLIVQVQRLRDGTRRVTHVTEVVGMEGDMVTLQDLVLFELSGEDSRGRLQGTHRSTGLRPAFWERAAYFGLADQLHETLEEVGAASV